MQLVAVSIAGIRRPDWFRIRSIPPGIFPVKLTGACVFWASIRESLLKNPGSLPRRSLERLRSCQERSTAQKRHRFRRNRAPGGQEGAQGSPYVRKASPGPAQGLTGSVEKWHTRHSRPRW